MYKKLLKFIFPAVALFALLVGLTVVGEAAWQPEISVGLLSGQQKFTVMLNREARFTAANKKFVTLKANQMTEVSRDGDGLKVNGKILPGDTWELRPFDPRQLSELVVKINGREYRGGLKVMRRGSGLTVANVLPVEQYLWGVVPEEMPADWPIDALKAQSVAARTYAMKNRGRHQADGYDLCATTHCQVYEGKRAEMSKATKAVSDTYGEVLVNAQEKLIDAFFHTDSGGMTEHSEHVWGTHLPYLRAAKEVKQNTLPWEKKIALKTLESRFSLGELKKIEMSPLKIGNGTGDRSPSGRVLKVTLHFSGGKKTVTGLEMRSMFGLNSTMFDMSLGKDVVVFKGYGMGHGLGMSQWGAKAWAQSKNYRDILLHYYHGVKIKKVY